MIYHIVEVGHKDRMLKVFAFSCLFALAYGLGGGISPVPVDDPDIQRVLKHATEAWRANKNFGGAVLPTVKTATKQVVQGMMYRMNVDFGMTGCDASEKQLNKCKVTDSDTCVVKVWERVWLKDPEKRKISMTCDSDNQSDMLVGGVTDAKVDAKAMRAADFAMEAYNARVNSMYRHVMTKIVKVQTQVVAGIKYILTIQLGQSGCRNNMNNKGRKMDECPLADSAKVKECVIEVVDTPWMTPKMSLSSDFQCKNVENQADDELTEENPLDGILVHGEPQIHKEKLSKEEEKAKHHEMFQSFKAKYGRKYNSDAEEKIHFNVFRDNMRFVDYLNKKSRSSAVYGMTKFADIKPEDFKKMHMGLRFKPDDLVDIKRMKKAKIPSMKDIPAAFDWRSSNPVAVTPVKNQGSCGSCWAFSTTGNIEGQWAIKTGKLVSLSEQELVDCDKIDQGCNGGLPSDAYKEIKRLGGLETEKEYPYKGEDEKCVFKKSDVRVYINDSVTISQNETEIAAWLAKNGPISIGINAFAMQFYMGGIAHPWSIFCNPKELDHGVLIVGYGTKGSEPYWIVKNSWGPDWGENGYYLVYRGDGTCGLNTMCTSSVVD